MRPAIAAVALLALSACNPEQGWTFRNGMGLPEGPPPRIVAEVFEGGDCGFACRPAGLRRYCHELVLGASGPAPEGLDGGARYCFMGTALDEAGEAYAVGCAVMEAGGADIEITLSAIDEGRFIARQCDTRPVIRLDAGGGGMDAGPPPEDAGGPPDTGPMIDTGPPRTDAGLPSGAPVSVEFRYSGNGGIFIHEAVSGDPIGSQPLASPIISRTIDAFVGFPVIIEAVPSGGSTFVGWSGSGCGLQNPCDFTFDRTEVVTAVFQ